ncbi:MAG: hypothetical protein LAT64_05595 [Phycisphaerales bacterium]|nr:hypothetical protein [Planctomycetota bacterium]MCH8508230.1 hypothetical protein [Phycisphaerales bacterium]
MNRLGQETSLKEDRSHVHRQEGRGRECGVAQAPPIHEGEGFRGEEGPDQEGRGQKNLREKDLGEKGHDHQKGV